MDILKDKLPVIGIGLAAIAIAGYIVFGLDKSSEKKKKKEEPFEEKIESEQPKAPRLDSAEQFFIPASLSKHDQYQKIAAWVKNQITLLLQDGELKLESFKLSKADFYWLSHIIECKFKTESQELRQDAQKDRLEIIKEQGFESEEYLDALHTYVSTAMAEEYYAAKVAVYRMAGKNPDLYDISEEHHVGLGNTDYIEKSEIKRHLEILNHYPLQGEGKKVS